MKTRCELSKKEYAEKEKENLAYRCEKCKRGANNKEKLCKPKKINKKRGCQLVSSLWFLESILILLVFAYQSSKSHNFI